jgi:hypothetical protein
VLGTIDP